MPEYYEHVSFMKLNNFKISSMKQDRQKFKSDFCIIPYLNNGINFSHIAYQNINQVLKFYKLTFKFANFKLLIRDAENKLTAVKFRCNEMALWFSLTQNDQIYFESGDGKF